MSRSCLALTLASFIALWLSSPTASAVVLASGTGPASAQLAGGLAGVIRDATGAVLPAVAVSVSGDALTGIRTSMTNAQGRYEFANLPAGLFRITATLRGFDSHTAEGRIEAGVTAVDLVLTVSSVFEVVTVTAMKTSATDIQSTPVAITALAGTALEQMAAHSVQDLAGMVPTLTISQHTGLAQVTIRGIGTNLIFTGSDPSSTINVDGVYLARPAMVFADFLDLERVEVLRGPQGTLYGRNSVGGTINIITRLPTNTLHTSLRLTAGSYNTLRAEGDISGPLVKDKVMANVAFIRGTRSGFETDLDHPDHSLGGDDTWAGRGHLRFVFGTKSELLLSGDYGRFEGIPLTYAKPIAAKPGFSAETPASLWEVRTNHLTTGKNVQQGASAKLTLPVNDAIRLNSLTAWRGSDHHYFIDADLTEQNLQTYDYRDVQHQVSEELSLAGHTPTLTWIGGAFFFGEHDQQPNVRLTQYDRAIQVRPFPRIQARAGALFAEATYKPWTRVSLTGGLRYTDEKKDFENTGGVFRLGTETPVPGTVYDYVDAVTYHAWTPKVGVSLQAARDTFVYASAARGFKSGGFNPSSPAPGRAFNPEFAWTYEGGVKSTIASDRVRANAAIFYTDYRDLQVQSFISLGVLDISNAASAKITGLEVEAAAKLAPRLQLASSFSWLDATYDRYIAVVPGLTQDVTGHRLNNAPQWSGSESAVYEFATGGAGTMSVRGDLSWQSRVFYTPFNDAIETQQAYGLLHLRAGFEPRNHRWELGVYARNVANHEYITGTASFPVNAIGGRPGDPRNWGTQFTVRY